MSENRTLILDQERIALKVKRMAFQIWENNTDQQELTMIGIAEHGYVLAQHLARELESVSPIKVNLISLAFDKANPLQDLPDIQTNLDNKSLVIVDDVANSGKVLLYALRPVLQYMPAKILIAVLVDRKHKAYPIKPDIVGHSLFTTLQEHIRVESDGTTLTGAYLQ